MKKQLEKLTIIWLIVPLFAFSQTDTTAENFSELYVLTPISSVRKIQTDYDKCKEYKADLDKYKAAYDLQKVAINLALGRDTVRTEKVTVQAEQLSILKTSRTDLKKQLRKNKIGQIWNKTKFPMGFISGTFFGIILTKRTLHFNP